jgi:glycoprotein-N-acetylgalactosamine 3-beta-galactosyltransferase
MRKLFVVSLGLFALVAGLSSFYIFWTSRLYNTTLLTKAAAASDISVVKHDTAEFLKKKVRVLCWIMTSPDTLRTKAIHVKNTWGQRCNTLLFFSSKDDAEFPAIGIKTEEGREHLTAKTMHAFSYIYEHHINDADWFMKADDDTYVIVENLRLLLAEHSPDEPVFFGHHFHVIVQPQGYFSGGAGYVLSKEALKRFGQTGFHNHSLCHEDSGAEDVEMGQCMQNLGVKTGQSYDKQGRSRFHCLTMGNHLHRQYPDWYLQYDSHGAKSGIDSISEYPISFHYVDPNEMLSLEYYTHRLRTHGRGEGSVAASMELHPYYVSTAG